MRTIAAFGLAVLAIGGATFVQRVRAADLAYPPPPVFNEPDPQFEFGTGWYLRGDASFGPEDQPRLTAVGFDNHTEIGWGAGGGIGYKFTSGFRADVTADYLDPLSSNANIGGVAYRDGLQRYDGLANIYFDLGTWYGLTPYVGAGVGVAVFNPTQRATSLVAGAPLAPVTSPSSTTELAWAAMAGVSYQVDPNIAIDLGYRHLDLGRFNTTTAGFLLNKHFTAEEVRVGVRYMLN